MTSTNITDLSVMSDVVSGFLSSKKNTSGGDQSGSDFASVLGSKISSVNVTVTTKDTTVSLTANFNSSDSQHQMTVKAPASDQTAQTQTDSSSRSQSSKSLSEDDAVEIKDEMDDYISDVKEELKDSLGVSEEDIENAMETLGLTFADLINPDNMTALLQELTGQTDVTTLISADTGLNILDTLNSLAEQDLAGASLSQEQWQLVEETDIDSIDFLNTMQQIVDPSQVNENVIDSRTDTPDLYEEEYFSSDDQNLSADDYDLADISEDDINALLLDSSDSNDTPAEQTDVQVSADDELDDTAADMVQTTVSGADSQNTQQNPDSFSNSQQNLFKNNSGNLQTNTSNISDSVLASAQNQTAGVTNFQEEMLQQVSSYLDVDTQSVIEQIVESAKSRITETVKSMELQLNPENLGHMIMSVSEKQGDIEAHLYAQNEAVKQALENQMADLQAKFHEQGLKVTQIDITVSARAFEERLDNEAGSNQYSNERDDQSGTADEYSGTDSSTNRTENRSINLGDIENGIPAMMNAAEALEASIMRDNGNTVSLRA